MVLLLSIGNEDVGSIFSTHYFLETRNFPFLSASAPANFLFQMFNYFSSLFLTISSPFLCYFLKYPLVFPPFFLAESVSLFLSVSSLITYCFLPPIFLFSPSFLIISSIIPHSFLAVSSLVPYCFLLRPLLFHPLFLTDFLTYILLFPPSFLTDPSFFLTDFLPHSLLLHPSFRINSSLIP